MTDKEFEGRCLNERKITKPSAATLIQTEEQRNSLADRHKNNAEYFLEGTKALLQSNTPLLAMLTGYFAMEHKANQLLVLKGYKIEDHACVQIALSKIVDHKDLAKRLSDMYSQRQDIGYRMFLRHSEAERKNAQQAVQEKVIPFMEEIDRLIAASQNKGFIFPGA